jgi:phenylalanyl-tRNA synthetase alpha chain
VGCSTCSQTGWMEILGCGMVHPQVLRNVGIDPDEWSGFAFGMGLDRVAMIKFDIPNIRTLFENDLRVLQQF